MRYSEITITLVKRLRGRGETYGEINKRLDLNIPKSTLSSWCRDVLLPPNFMERINKLNTVNLGKARSIAVEMNKIKREEFDNEIETTNLSIAKSITDKACAKIALAMLCLGEASKSGKNKGFYLGNSNPKIIILFIKLLKHCFEIDTNKFRCTVQCRDDQNIGELERFWQGITNISPKYFYKTRTDPRTKGKPTIKSDYKGVLRVDYFDKKIQLELESLSRLVYNIVSDGSQP